MPRGTRGVLDYWSSLGRFAHMLVSCFFFFFFLSRSTEALRMGVASPERYPSIRPGSRADG
jgi:hypothetical protein